MDIDDDGVVARYKGKGYSYSDPEPMVILQAAPYFKDLEKYGDIGSTGYSITETYSHGQTDTNSVSFGLGVKAEVETSAFTLEASLGYALDWRESFSKEDKKSYYFSWET